MAGTGKRPVGLAGRSIPVLAAALLAASAVTAGAAQAAARPGQAAALAARPGGTAGGAAGCLLGHPGAGNGDVIRHVIYLQFDNTHYLRDNPNVPSDLEQMPSLLHFLTGNGTLITHEHTPLIAHTADDIVTSESGLYGSDQGMPIANEYNYYTPGGATHTAGSFAYWTDPIVDYDTGAASKPVGDASPTLVGANGQNAPAPWVPYTRAGCNFGTVAGADTELENTLPDVPHVFGAELAGGQGGGEPEAAEQGGGRLRGTRGALRPGLGGVLRGARRGSRRAARRAGRVPRLPGAVREQVHPAGDQPVRPGAQPGRGRHEGLQRRHRVPRLRRDDRRPTRSPTPSTCRRTASRSPTPTSVDLHDSWTAGTPVRPRPGRATSGSCTPRTRRSARSSRELAAHGITKANTLFVVTADEGDHFVGSAPTPAGCNGVTVPCHYSKIGEVNGNLTGLLRGQGHHDAVRRRGRLRARASTCTASRAGRTRPGAHAGAGDGQADRRATWSPARPSQAHQLPGRPGGAEDPAHGHR